MIDGKFLTKVIDSPDETFTYNGRWFDVCYESSIMDSYIEAFTPNTDDSIKVYFYECCDKPTQIFKKKFIDTAVDLFNERLN